MVQFPDLWRESLIIVLPGGKVINKVFHLPDLCSSCHSSQVSNVETPCLRFHTIFESDNSTKIISVLFEYLREQACKARRCDS